MKLSLATKLFLGFSLVLAVFGAVPIFGIIQLDSLRNQINILNQGYLPLDRVVAEVETLHETARRSLDGILQFYDSGLQRSLLKNTRRSYLTNITSRLARAQAILKRIDPQNQSEQDQRFIQNLETRLDEIRHISHEYDGAIELVQLSLEEDPLPAGELAELAGVRTQGRTLSRKVRVLKLALKNMITTKMLTVERDEGSAIGVILWLTIAAVLVGTLVSLLSMLALRPIRRLAQAARSISKGDFSQIVDVSSQDEVGLLAGEFNRMARSLEQREEDLVRNQGQLEDVNRELRQSSIDLALMKLFNDHIIRSMPSGILVTDARGVVTTVNPAAEQLWRLDPNETIGKRLEEAPIGQALEGLMAEWDRVFRDQELLVFEAMEFEIPDRGQVLVDLYVSPLRGTDGDTPGVLLVGEDVTDKVRTKQALLQSERLATIGRMSALVAHEIRNPLSSIGLNTELLEEEVEELPAETKGEARSIIGAISREVERLVEVTDEYLRFARLPKPSLSPEGLNTILEDLLHFITGELDGAGVELRHDLDPSVGCVPADEGQLRQAFLNLIKNSAESMPEGGVLTVTTGQENGRVQVRISDTGKGIDQKALGRIFDPFFSTRDGGTGLGLSLTQQIVSEHGGQITCESSPGEGTLFMVDLPACKAETEDG